MARRTRKPPIKPELRREWLRRHEENNESPPQIAQRDHYDVRTVRKQIGQAQQERESREARLLVLRAAVERHYDDLLAYSRRLDPQFSSGADSMPSPDYELLESALRQHLPRSPIWGHLTNLKQLREEEASRRQSVQSLIEEILDPKKEIRSLTADVNASELNAHLTQVFMFQVGQWSRGNIGLVPKDDLGSEPGGEGRKTIHYGAFTLGTVNSNLTTEVVKKLQRLLEDVESRLKAAPEYQALEKIVTDIDRVSRKLQEQLTTIRLRRIIPGRCKYCPL